MLVSDLDIKCCLSNVAATTREYESVRDGGIISRNTSSESLTTGTPSDLSAGTIGPGTWLLIATGAFALTSATSTRRASTIRWASTDQAAVINAGQTTTSSVQEFQRVVTIATFTADTAITIRLDATFSAGTISAAGVLQAIRLF